MDSLEEQPQAREAKKVAILGFADTWKQAPFDDPTVEMWGLNELHKYVPRWDRWFEMHDAATLGVTKRDVSDAEQQRHLAWLSSQPIGKPIYMQPQFCDGRFPAATPLPIEGLIGKFGRYFTSSIGYMLGLAILEDYDWIGLYGIDLSSDIEYRFQRPNAEYLIGMAKGMRKTVVFAEGSAICKSPTLYGYDTPMTENPMIALVKQHAAGLKKKHEETLAILNTLDGAIQECENFVKIPEYKERGVTLTGY